MNLHSASQYASVSMWYGLHRFQQALQAGLVNRARPAAEGEGRRSVIDTVLGQNGQLEPAPRATYAHPYLGKYIDILI